MIRYQLTESDDDRSLTLIFDDGTTRSVPGSHPRFDWIVQLLRDGADADDVLAELDVAQRVGETMRRLSERVTFAGGSLFFDGDRIDNALSRHIIRMVEADDENWRGVVAFMENLAQNPSRRSRQQLWRWLDDRDFAITQDGFFIAYKGVQDCDENLSVSSGSNTVTVNGTPYTGHIPNPVGAVVEMARTQVDDDKEVGCSHGLHAGTYEYARGFGHKLLIVKINPRDVVSVPRDCDWQKLRTCRYAVVEARQTRFDGPTYSEPLFPDDEDDEQYDDDWYDEVDDEYEGED